MNLNLKDNNAVQDTVSFINKIKEEAENRDNLFIDMSEVISFDEGSGSMMLLVLEDMRSLYGIRWTGTMPVNESSKKDFKNSGFLNNVGHFLEKGSYDEENIMIQGDVEPDKIAEAVTKGINFISKDHDRYSALYEILIEMKTNSINHAFKKRDDSRWVLSVYHDKKNNKVNFSFVDNGVGIIQTIHKKGIFSEDTIYTNKTILMRIFKGKANKTATDLRWRGKGLPTIYRLYETGKIKNLKVITNVVFLDFDKNFKGENRVKFSGTYYFWSLTEDCKQYFLKNSNNNE